MLTPSMDETAKLSSLSGIELTLASDRERIAHSACPNTAQRFQTLATPFPTARDQMNESTYCVRQRTSELTQPIYAPLG